MSFHGKLTGSEVLDNVSREEFYTEIKKGVALVHQIVHSFPGLDDRFHYNFNVKTSF